MKSSASTQGSIHAIRRRLQMLLLRAFGAVVLLTVLFVLAAVLLFASRQASQSVFFRAPIAYLLEIYYQGKGDWQGVEQVFNEPSLRQVGLLGDWRSALLLDEADRLVYAYGEPAPAGLAEPYLGKIGDLRIALHADGQTVGALVFPAGAPGMLGRLLSGLFLPVLFVSLFLGLLTLLIGMLLTRRVVEPLAQVIAAAQSVAAGDLSARVPVGGSRDDLHALSANFNDMAAALERSDQGRRALLADIAHELRTPLTVLRGRMEGIVDGVYPADAAHVAPALEEVYLLERLVDDLRLLSLLENRQLHLEPRPLDLGEHAAKAIGTFQAQADELDVALTLQVEPGLPQVLADPQRLEQVTGNLIGNALRYVPPGGTIAVSVQSGAGGADFADGISPAGGVSLTVRDDGPGVPEADLPYLFDRFWRGEKSRSRETGGAGLGLAIARQLVEAQGGRVWARNRDEGGLEAGFWLEGLVYGVIAQRKPRL